MSNITWVVMKKELVDMFRDKKTLLVGILIPLLVFPIIFGVMGRSMKGSKEGVEKNLKVALVDEGKSSFGEFLKAQKNIKITESKNVDEDVKSGKLFAAIEIPSGFDVSIQNEKDAKLKIIYDGGSKDSSMAKSIIQSYVDGYSKQVINKRLQKRKIDTKILNPVVLEEKTLIKEEEGIGKFIISMLIPLLLVIYSVTGPLPAATDLGAGEKERGTLEPLLTTQAGRMSLLWGKFLAITVMGSITALASILGVIIAFNQKNGMFTEVGKMNFSISPLNMLLIVLVFILTTMVFGALELSISIYARSFKEAQTYLSPITIIAIIPTYATYMLDAKNIKNMYFHIPLANTVCIMKEFLAGIYNLNHIFTTLAWTAFYIVIVLLFARYMFSREEVIFRT